MRIRLIEVDENDVEIRQLYPPLTEGKASGIAESTSTPPRTLSSITEMPAPAPVATAPTETLAEVPEPAKSMLAAAAAEQATQERKPDTILAFVAKGPAQQAYRDMLVSVFGEQAAGLGHFNMPAKGDREFCTGYAFQAFSQEGGPIEEKLEASEHASHFEPDLMVVTAEEEAQAIASTSAGQLPVITLQ